MNNITPLDENVVSQLKTWDWDFIIDFGYNTISHLRGGQMNFLRGTLVEELISRQDTKLEIVRQDHKDFHWHRYDVSLELKSQFNMSMYNKGGRLKEEYKVNLCNMRSMRKIKPDQICDIVLVLRKDGAFIVPKNVATQNIVQKGSKVDIIVGSSQIIEISGLKSLSLVQQHADINETVLNFCNFLIDEAKSQYLNRPNH